MRLPENEVNTKAGYKLHSDQINKEMYREINPGNPVVKAQRQISSQETTGVYSPQQE